MKDQNSSDEVTKILEEAPNARKALRENYENLLNVADYCYNSYIQVSAAPATAKTTTVQSMLQLARRTNTNTTGTPPDWSTPAVAHELDKGQECTCFK